MFYDCVYGYVCPLLLCLLSFPQSSQCEVTDQLAVVLCQLEGVGVWEEQQLRVGVDGEIGLDDGLVFADEISHVLDLNLRLRLGATEGIAAWVAGRSSS